MKYFVTITALLICSFAAASEPLRSHYLLDDDWQFIYSTEQDIDNARYVTLPHTFTCATTPVESGYLRTSAKYVRELFIPAEWQGKRLFLRFGGVQSVADVFVNGRHVGEHRGGFTAFTVEITHRINYGVDNQLVVEVSNVPRNDVLPISTDQNLYGGIYRSVELMVTPKSIFSPFNYGSDGVYVVQQKVDAERAAGVVRAYLSTPDVDNATVNVRIVAPDGYEVECRTVRATKITPEHPVEIPYEIAYPELWSPDSPSLYTVEVSLGDMGTPSDYLSFQTGFRTISISDDNKLCINGKPIDVRGVNLAHDSMLSGSARSAQEFDDDLRMIADMGANAIRSTVGPHPHMLYDECDKSGMLVWIDMPLTRSLLGFADICYLPTEGFRRNAREQLHEIIAQNYNHPSVVMWGLFSLVWQRGDDVVPFIGELNDLAHSLDKSRPTVGCSNSNGAINFITDLVVFRQDAGWTKGSFDDVEVWCRQLSANKSWSKLRYGVCYGEEGIVEQQSDDIERATRGTMRLTERRQTLMHERYVAQLTASEQFWGLWLDNMFDHASTRHTYGINHTGVVCFDHHTTKDAYHLYRAKWNKRAHTLYIAERRWTERRDTLQQFKIYCSSGMPTVVVGEDSVAVSEVSPSHYVTDTLSLRGEVSVRAVDAAGRLSDSVRLRVGWLRGCR